MNYNLCYCFTSDTVSIHANLSVIAKLAMIEETQSSCVGILNKGGGLFPFLTLEDGHYKQRFLIRVGMCSQISC